MEGRTYFYRGDGSIGVTVLKFVLLIFVSIFEIRSLLMRARQHLQTAQTNPPPRNVPLINLSSSGQSDSDSEKENHCNDSLHTANTIKPPPKSSNYNSRIPQQPFSQKPANSLQFSTLSLDEGSVPDFDHQLRMLIGQNRELQRQNQELKRENVRLKGEMRSMEERDGRQEMEAQYQYQLQQSSAQIQQWKTKCKKLQQDMRRLEKQYENRLINQELPSKKTISDENSRIYKELTEKIKDICSKFIEKLSQEKMNPKVEALITDHVNDLLHLSPNPPPNTINRFAQHSLQASITTIPSRASKLTTSKQESELNISSDYRLLEKSIEKLKAMEKEIDARTPLVRKQREESSLLYRSGALDQSSISGLDKSKSKRKRIFQ